MSFVKNRLEKDVFSVGFSNRLASGENIVSATVLVEWAVLYVWNDVTAGVLSGLPSISSDGKTVQFTLGVAPTAEDQEPGQYRAFVTAVTSTGRSLVGTVDLMVTE